MKFTSTYQLWFRAVYFPSFCTQITQGSYQTAGFGSVGLKSPDYKKLQEMVLKDTF